MLNKYYYNEKVRDFIKKELEREESILLQNFLGEDLLKKVVRELNQRKFKRIYKPLSASYEFFEWDKKFPVEGIKEFLESVLKKKYGIRSKTMYCFEHKDYLLLKDEKFEQEGIKVILDLTSDWNKEANGYHAFVENNEEKVRISPLMNSLSIVKTNAKMKSLIKYVNHNAKAKRYFLEVILI